MLGALAIVPGQVDDPVVGAGAVLLVKTVHPEGDDEKKRYGGLVGLVWW